MSSETAHENESSARGTIQHAKDKAHSSLLHLTRRTWQPTTTNTPPGINHPTRPHQLVDVADPVAQDVWVRVAAPVGVEVRHPPVRLLAGDEVAVLAADRQARRGGEFADLVADVRPRLPGPHHQNALTGELLFLAVLLFCSFRVRKKSGTTTVRSKQQQQRSKNNGAEGKE